MPNDEGIAGVLHLLHSATKPFFRGKSPGVLTGGQNRKSFPANRLQHSALSKTSEVLPNRAATSWQNLLAKPPGASSHKHLSTVAFHTFHEAPGLRPATNQGVSKLKSQIIKEPTTSRDAKQQFSRCPPRNQRRFLAGGQWSKYDETGVALRFICHLFSQFRGQKEQRSIHDVGCYTKCG